MLKGEGIKAGAYVTLRLPVFWAAMTGIVLQAADGTFPCTNGQGANAPGGRGNTSGVTDFGYSGFLVRRWFFGRYA